MQEIAPCILHVRYSLLKGVTIKGSLNKNVKIIRDKCIIIAKNCRALDFSSITKQKSQLPASEQWKNIDRQDPPFSIGDGNFRQLQALSLMAIGLRIKKDPARPYIPGYVARAQGTTPFNKIQKRALSTVGNSIHAKLTRESRELHTKPSTHVGSLSQHNRSMAHWH